MSLTNSQYETIMREYSYTRAKNSDILEKRIGEINEIAPEYESLRKQIGELSVNAAASRIQDGTPDTDYKSKLYALKEKQTQLLIKHGKPADWLDPIYTCPICKDTGYIENKKCSCFKKKAIELIYKDSNLKNMAGDFTFDDFDTSLYSDEEKDPVTGKSARDYAVTALETAKSFVNEFDTNKYNLFIYGNTGLGKTFLSTCIATALINTTHSVVYVTATELFNRLDTFTEESADSPLLECDLLIIDDLGTEYNNTYTVSKLFYCLNERLLRSKPCIISTNLDLSAIRDLYTERIFSRIVSGYKILKLYGRDIRTAKVIGS